MAAHINDVRSTDIPKVSPAEFVSAMQPGDLVFCWGSAAISKAIEAFTSGPSHVLKVWQPFPSCPWLTFEAEFMRGVRFGQFADYLNYAGDLVLCRRPLTSAQVEAELTVASTLLDDSYDTIEFASLIARKISDKFPLIQPSKELYCSGAQQAVALKSLPFDVPSRPWATPEQLFTDASVSTICGLLHDAK